MEKSELEKILNLSIKEFKVSAGSNAGDNIAGTLKAFDILTTSNERLYLIKKFIDHSNPIQRDFTIKNQSFRVENTFYSTLVPALELFASTKMGSSFSLPIPKYYAGFNNDKDDYIILEDLRPAANYSMYDKYIGYKYEHVKLILTKVAEFHALSYAFIRWEGEKMFDNGNKLKIFNKNMLDDPEIHEFIKFTFNGAYKVGMELVGRKDKNLAEKMKHLGCDTIPEMFSTPLKTDKEYFPVFILGDLWTNNIMMKNDNNGNPIDIKFIDFQLTRRSNIFEELQYFIFTSTTPEFRKIHLTQVLMDYYQSFVNTLNLLKCPIPINFTKGFLIDEFRKCYPAAYKYLHFAIPLQLGQGNAFDASENGAENGNGPSSPPKPTSTSDAAEMDPAALQTEMFIIGMKTSMEKSPRAIDRLVDVTKEMAELNII